MTQDTNRSPEHRYRTLAVGSGPDGIRPGEGGPGDVIPPLHLSTTFEWAGSDEVTEHAYSLERNPTRVVLEDQIARIEGGEDGLVFASGMAAISTTMLSLVPPGGHIVSSDSVYSGTEKLLTEMLAGHFGIDVDFIDAREPENVAAVADSDTDLIWVETPSNPLVCLCDVRSIADIAQDHDVAFGVDSTFASPYFQAPLKLGADVVVHSTTKYLNGHSDSTGGAVITDDDAVFQNLAFSQQTGLGNMLAPFDCYLVSRGIKTLPTRMEDHEENAMVVLDFLRTTTGLIAFTTRGSKATPNTSLPPNRCLGIAGCSPTSSMARSPR
jgi:cystathionine gamma-lyase